MTEHEKAILSIMERIKMKDDEVDLVFYCLDKCGDKKEENTKKLLNYILAKGAYIATWDIWHKCEQICMPREAHYRTNMFLRYIGAQTDDLDTGSCYHVLLSYENDKEFLIENKYGKQVVYPAELFQIMDVSKVRYLGGTTKDWIQKIENGLVVGKTYQVSGFEGGIYTLEGGFKCMLNHTEAVGFVPAKPKQPNSFRKLEDALLCLRSAIEYGQVAYLEDGLSPTCKYVSQNTGVEYNGVSPIVAHMRKVTRHQLENDVFLDCALATVTKSTTGNRFGVGEQCLAIYAKGAVAAICFVTLERGLINGIYILTEPYELELF